MDFVFSSLDKSGSMVIAYMCFVNCRSKIGAQYVSLKFQIFSFDSER